MNWKPAYFTISPNILAVFADIERLIGRIEGVQLFRATPKLRARNRARSVWGSTGIEGSTSSIEQIEAIMRGEQVGLSKKELLEIRNALNAYAKLPTYDPCSIDSLLTAHALMMGGGLMLSAGRFRQNSVEVYITENKTREMPSWKIIPESIETIFANLRSSTEPALLKAIRFHFDFVNLHPFMDGNGRIARLWQNRLMMEIHPLFEFLDVESMVFDRREEYYRQIRIGQESEDIAGFVCFMLEQVRRSLEFVWKNSAAVAPSQEQRLAIASEFFKQTVFSRRDYVQLFKTISAVTASRDLASGVKKDLLSRQGDKRTAVYRFHQSMH